MTTMPNRKTCWKEIIRVLSDGKPRRFAEIADMIGYQVNTVERYVHDINSGTYGNYRIVTEKEPDKPTVLARLSTHSYDKHNSIIALCKERLTTYPNDCPERKKIEQQISELISRSHT